jgi:hypothetical protein
LDQNTFFLLLGGGLAAIALAFTAAAWSHRQRSRFMRKAGLRAGLTPLVPGENFHFTPVPLLRKKGRGIGVALRGTWQGRTVMVFDLFHPSGKTMAMQTVLMMELPEAHLPEFAAIPRDLKLYAPTMDIRPVEPAPPGLNQRWHLYCRNGRWPLGEEITTWLAQQAGGWSFEGTGQVLYVYRRAVTATPRRLHRWIDAAVAQGEAFTRQAAMGQTSGTPPKE